MQFIELTYLDDTKVFVNPHYILAFDVQEGNTQVYLNTGADFGVKEDLQEILARIL